MKGQLLSKNFIVNLELVDTKITADACDAIGAAVGAFAGEGFLFDFYLGPRSNLKYFNFDFNDVGDAGVLKLAEGMKWNTSLQTLSLNYCGVGAQALPSAHLPPLPRARRVGGCDGAWGGRHFKRATNVAVAAGQPRRRRGFAAFASLRLTPLRPAEHWRGDRADDDANKRGFIGQLRPLRHRRADGVQGLPPL